MTEQLESAVRGDRATIGRVIAQCQPPVARLCRALVGSAAGGWSAADRLADDLLPRVVSTVVREWDPARPLYGWLIEAFESQALSDDRLANPEPTTPMAIVSRALGRRAGMVLWLRVIEGLSTLECARVLGLRTGEVQLLQHRVLDYLGHSSTAAAS
jgi:RNA polymerase sigma-70 factor (ECF subfamily)